MFLTSNNRTSYELHW